MRHWQTIWNLLLPTPPPVRTLGARRSHTRIHQERAPALAPYGLPMAPYGLPMAPYGLPMALYGLPMAPCGLPTRPHQLPPSGYGAMRASLRSQGMHACHTSPAEGRTMRTMHRSLA